MKPKVLIVGAGIGGLTLARFLEQQGLQVVVVEKAPELRPVGAGLVLAANAIRVLDRLGMVPRLKELGQETRQGLLCDAAGLVLSEMTFATPDSLAIALHRSALQTVLLEGLQSPIRLGQTVAQIHQTETVEVSFSTGLTERFDLVIGADGLRSSLRTLLFGPIEPNYAGYTSWRFVTQNPKQNPVEVPVEMWGRGKRFGLVPIGQNQVYGYTTQNEPHTASPKPDLEQFKQTFAGFGSWVPSVFNQLSEGSVLIHTAIEEIRRERWFKGRVALLGDAAHAMTPNMGQGAGMAIEDAYVLARALQQQPIPQALQTYQEQRYNRVRQIQNASRQIGQVGQWASPLAVSLRNNLLRLAPKGSGARQLQALLQSGPLKA